MMPSRLPPDAVAEHPGRRPAGPVLVAGQNVGAFGEPPRHREDQRHRHVGGVFGQHARRIGDGDAALIGGGDVDIVDAVAEIGDQLELLAGLGEQRGVDLVGDGRHQHVGGFHRLGQLGLGHRLVFGIEARVEQLAHAQFDAVGQLARDDDQRLFRLWPCVPPAACSALFNPISPHTAAVAHIQASTWPLNRVLPIRWR